VGAVGGSFTAQEDEIMEMQMQAATVNRPAFMEHRWGARVPLDLPVRLELAGELLGYGRLRNASISGALVITASKLPVLAALDVVVTTTAAREGRIVLPACVVRRAGGAIAVEWRDMACDTLVALLRAADGHSVLFKRD
jgi:hypothetical protein